MRLALCACLLLAALLGTGSAQATGMGADPVIGSVPNAQWEKMVKTGTWRKECPVGRNQLARLDVNYWGFDGQTHRGYLVANKDSIKDLEDVFVGLYKAHWPIYSMKGAEEYGGDVNKGLKANNTSAYNCRKPGQINAPVAQSPHANGRAIDINPALNPWKDPRCGCWMPSGANSGRIHAPGYAYPGSLVNKLFKKAGWIWQNIKVPDYMHFDTGYPSQDR